MEIVLGQACCCAKVADVTHGLNAWTQRGCLLPYILAHSPRRDCKVREMECLVAEVNIDIVGVMETWWTRENQYRRGREVHWK